MKTKLKLRSKIHILKLKLIKIGLGQYLDGRPLGIQGTAGMSLYIDATYRDVYKVKQMLVSIWVWLQAGQLLSIEIQVLTEFDIIWTPWTHANWRWCLQEEQLLSISVRIFLSTGNICTNRAISKSYWCSSSNRDVILQGFAHCMKCYSPCC